jgi:hypothetical protein
MSIRIARPLASGLSLAIAFALATAEPARAVCNNVQFASPLNLPASSNPNQVVVGDFNEDGVSDLAAAVSQLSSSNGTGAHVAVFIGSGSGGVGNGGFASAVDYPTGSACFGIVVGDFNEDGIQDLATSNYKGNSVSVLLGQGTGGTGNGTFSAAVSYPAGNGAWHLATGDFDEDGITDLAVSNNVAPGGVTVLHGLGSGGVGNGTFIAQAFYPTANIATDIHAADLNEDGIEDLVVAVPYTGRVAVLIGQGAAGVGNGSFASAVTYVGGLEPFNLTVADLDADGILDLAVGNGTNGGVQFLRGGGAAGVGDGTFVSPVLITTGNVTATIAADVNQDGILDLIANHADGFGATPLKLLLGNGNGTFGPPQSYGGGWLPCGFAIGKFDGSAKVDLAYCSYLDNQVSVMLGVCEGPPPPPGVPVITSVRDVPHDQGGKLFLTWTASGFDVEGGPVTSYRVWRRIPAQLALQKISAGSSEIRSRRIEGAGTTAATIIYWEAAAVLPAQRLEGYGYTAATPQDSMAGNNPYTAFYITAATNSLDIFYDSAADSGYSVDNIPPEAPQNVTMTAQSQQVHIVWSPNHDADLELYRVHRGSSAGFVPSSDNLIASVEDAEYIGEFTSQLYYKLIAVDKHGNGSSAALASLGSPTGMPGPAAFIFALDGVTPHPARSGSFGIRFRLADRAPATLEIMDVSGRKVIETRVDRLGPGEHVFDVDRVQRLPAGVYLVRLSSGARNATTKAVVLQ